mgnify:CR=1 FL=1
MAGEQMKLNGIWSSKSRRAVHERNLAYRVPVREPLPVQPESVHRPQPGADNTVNCCGARFSVEAHTLHMAGVHLATECGGVKVAGISDPWLIDQDARMRQQRSIDGVSDRQAEQDRAAIEAYYARERPQPRVVAGTSRWMSDD